MKKNIKNIIGFVVFIIIIFFIFTKATWLFRGNGNEAREDICGFRNQGKIDVVLYGASNLLRYYQPLEAWDKKGYTSYNYATSSGPGDSIKDFIAESRSSNEAALYVCDIRAILLINDMVYDQGIRNWADSLPIFSIKRWRGITSYLKTKDYEDKDVLSYYLDIAHYHTNYEALSDPYQWSYLDTGSIYNIDKGFSPNTGHIPFEKPQVNSERVELTEQQKKALEELLDYCNREKLQVLFICNPFILAEDDGEKLNTINDIISDRGYTFVDFNRLYDEIGLDFETDFGDVNHVNYLGSVKYTDYLMNYISSNYSLPDHRNDPEYDKWNEDYEIYTSSEEFWETNIRAQVEEHLRGKENGDKLKREENFAEWLSLTKSSNYSVIIVIKDMPKNFKQTNPITGLFEEYSINTENERYSGVWNGKNLIVESQGEGIGEIGIGVDGGRGTEKCSVSIPDGSILIGETNYYSTNGNIQIIVYDNNYKRVLDNVCLVVDYDSVNIKR